jgi:hypothetical protein
MLMGSRGIIGPTLGNLIAKVNKSTTRLQALIITPTIGLHTGVTGIDEVTASKVDNINLCLLNGKNINLQDYKIT